MKITQIYILIIILLIIPYPYYMCNNSNLPLEIKINKQVHSKKSTIITAYFEIKSKYPSHHYFKWIKNFLTIKDPVVIITSATLKQFMIDNRPAHLETKIIVRNMSQFFVRKRYGDAFWEKQHMMDIEKSIHKGEYLYWIWDEKSHWLKEIAILNPFQSKNFVWMDMGAFRNTKYNNKLVIQSDFTNNKVLANKMIFLRISKAIRWLQSRYMSKFIYKDVIKFNMYLGGGIFGGTKDAILRWHDTFYSEMDTWAKDNKFIGKDQTIMISCCHKNPELCAYVDPNHSFGDPFFYMQPWFHGETDNKVYIPAFTTTK